MKQKEPSPMLLPSVKQAEEKIANEIKAYRVLSVTAAKVIEAYTPCSRDNASGSQVLHTEGFMTEDRKAVISIPSEELMFKEGKIYDTVQLRFEEYLKKNGLKS